MRIETVVGSSVSKLAEPLGPTQIAINALNNKDNRT